MVLGVHRHVRRGEQAAPLWLVDQQVELRQAQLRIAGHVGQFVVDLPQHQDGFARSPAPGDHRQQVEGDVGVAGQAQVVRTLGRCRHQLGDQVQALGVDVAGGVAVVAADVVLLRGFAVQQAARLHEELLYADVRRQLVIAQVDEVGQFLVVGEHTLDEGFEETSLQAVAQGWAAEGQGGVDRQVTLGQLAHPCVERVDEGVGFAQAQWQAQVDMGRQATQDLVHCLVDGTALHRGLLRHPWIQGWT